MEELLFLSQKMSLALYFEISCENPAVHNKIANLPKYLTFQNLLTITQNRWDFNFYIHVQKLVHRYIILKESHFHSKHSWLSDFRCLCGNCRSMPTLQEAKCCQTTNVIDGKLESEDIKCITHHDGFIANCLNIHVLETSYYEYVIKNGPLEEHQLIHE